MDAPLPIADPPSSRKGGPRTTAGKARSRRNALRHGMRAETLLEELIGGERFEAFYQDLAHAICPTDAVEETLLQEVARHAAALEFAHHAERAVLLKAALPSAMLLGNPADEQLELVSAVTSEATEKASRYRRAHEKGLHAAMSRLQEWRAARSKVSPVPTVGRSEGHNAPKCGCSTEVTETPLNSYRKLTEEACEDRLRARFFGPDWQCSKCHHQAGYWLAARKHWQCAQCGHQVGLRGGTVMATSRLTFAAWYEAIMLLANEPRTTVAHLARHLSIGRGTAQRLLGVIKTALRGPHALSQFGGLLEPADLADLSQTHSEQLALPNEP